MPAAPHPTAHIVPLPVLFNTWKHHAGWVRERIATAASEREIDLKQLAKAVVVAGTKLMDLYTGQLPPWELAERILAQLRDHGHLEQQPFTAWVAKAGFRVVELPDDASRWVLRVGDGERHIHLHTARYSPHSIRVPGISLKTAIVASALALVRGQMLADLETVNNGRRDYLNLPPMAKLAATGGLGEVLCLFASPA
ncbi:MAG: hypothetical protein MUF18_19615 [Fimbriiglobus sp.]|jgi:hypothetical protein|nr:hypothetical protein [Fimbriiglobus sp.]